MSVQIANPSVIHKIEWLSAFLGVGKTAAIERALDAFKLDVHPDQFNLYVEQSNATHIQTLLAKMDALPDVKEPFDPMMWDAQGLPA